MALAGKWIQDGTFENMDGLLNAVGLKDDNMRKLLVQLKIELEINQNGDEWEFKMIAPHATRAMTFKSGDEVDGTSIVGRPVKSLIKIDGNQMTEIHKDPQNEYVDTHITRTVNGDVMDVCLEAENAKCTVKYNRA